MNLRAFVNRIAVFLVPFLLLAAAVPATAQISVTATTPNSAAQGTVNLNVTVSGSGFKKGAKAQWFVSGSTTNPGGVTVNSTAFSNSNTLVANITVAADAVISGFDVVVTNADGRTGKGTELFAVVKKQTVAACPVLTPLVTAPASCTTGQPGCLDPTFGTDPSWPGMVFTNTDGPTPPTNDMDGGRAVREMPDGRIVAMGNTTDPATLTNGFAAIRYSPDGSLDPTFGDGGIARQFLATTGLGVVAWDGVLQPDGSVVVVGTLYGSTYNQGAAVRFTPSGSLDTSFGSNGVFILTEKPKPNTYWNVDFEGVILDSSNNLLIGTTTTGGCQVVRLKPDGSLDSSFGSGGIVTLASLMSCGEGSMVPVAIQSTSTGKHFLVGGSINGSFGLVRLNWNGTVDSSFGPNGNGTVTTSWCGSGADSVHALAVDGNGNIFAAGRAQWGSSTSTINFGVAKYTPNGTADSTFGYIAPGGTQPSGKAAFDVMGDTEILRSVVVQSDGKILLSGATQTTVGGVTVHPFAVVRLNYDGSLDQSFGLADGNAGAVVTLPQGSPSQVPFRMSLDSAGRLLQTGAVMFDTGPYASWNLAIIRYIP